MQNGIGSAVTPHPRQLAARLPAAPPIALPPRVNALQISFEPQRDGGVIRIPVHGMPATELAGLPDDSLAAFRALAARIPTLIDDTLRMRLYAQVNDLRLSGEQAGLAREVYRFLSYGRPTLGHYARKWREHLGTQLSLLIVARDSETSRYFAPSEAPRLANLRKEYETSLGLLRDEYLAVGKTVELAGLCDRAQKAFRHLEEAFRLRRLGLCNKEIAGILKNLFETSFSAPQVSGWISGEALPTALALILPSRRRVANQSFEFRLPDEPSREWSYLLGVQVGATAYNSTKESVGIRHHSPLVRLRTTTALEKIGMPPILRVKRDPEVDAKCGEVRVRQKALVKAIFELTRGYTRLPWVYLATRPERVAFLRGITDSMAVVSPRGVHFTKHDGGPMLKELAILFSLVGVYGEVSLGQRRRFVIANQGEIARYRDIVGRRYKELDERLTQAAKPRGKTHPTVSDFRAFLRLKRSCPEDGPTELSQKLQATQGVLIHPRVIERWTKGTKPLCATRWEAVRSYKKELPHIQKVLKAAQSETPRSEVFEALEKGQKK